MRNSAPRPLTGPSPASTRRSPPGLHTPDRAGRMRLLESALPSGGGTLKLLKERAARQHPATLAERLNAQLKGAPEALDVHSDAAFAALVRADVMAIAKAGAMEPSLAADALGAAIEEGMLGQGILPTDRQALLAALDQLSIHRLYQKINLKVTPETSPAFTNVQVLEPPRAFRSGSFHTVFGVRLAKLDGSVFDGIFKPLKATEKNNPTTAGTGIPESDPQTAMRNIATLAYARKLGMDVIVDTQVALIDTRQAPSVSNLQLGLVMERAPGKPALYTDVQTLDRADVCAEVTKLQLLDHLTGQTDRYHENYFIDIGPDGRVKVTGIDNDQCFGQKLTDPADIRPGADGTAQARFRGVGLPPVVDTDMERSIQALTEGDIRSMLEDKLNEAEISAAIQRHQGVKAHIAQLREIGRVIDPGHWGEPGVKELLTEHNSYIGRERQWVPFYAAGLQSSW
ncbi:hypothetical protein AVME950_09205 [Acidovorax sp. SUPP950]|nr:hypothetical protein AVME950_09205 [Acidovorax sp. SUPP950]